MESNSYGEEFHQWENLPRKKVLYGVITLTTTNIYCVLSCDKLIINDFGWKNLLVSDPKIFCSHKMYRMFVQYV